jgi:hypothetical protein
MNDLMTSPSVVTALSSWKECVGAAGVSVSTLESFFGYVDAAEQQSGAPNPTQLPEIVHLAKIYGNCIEPVSTAMDAVRLRDRQQILDKYAPELDNIEKAMDQLVTKVSAQYGLKYPGAHV